jgi:SAM-dependent methyltransferase
VKLNDPTHGLKETDLERVSLNSESLLALGAFWDESARVDMVRAIAASADSDTFDASGRVDAERILPLLRPDAVVLEIGSGTGRIMQHLAPSCAELHGVDVSAEMVERGAQRLSQLSNVRFHLSNGYDLSMFADGKFDVAYAWVVFQHLPKNVAYNYMTEVRRVLKRDGVFYLQVPNLLRADHFDAFRHFSQPYFVEHPYPMNFYTPLEAMKLLNEAGLTMESITDDSIVIARRASSDWNHGPDVTELFLSLPEFQSVRIRLEQLEDRAAQLSQEVAKMRRVYDHHVVRAARRLRRLVAKKHPESVSRRSS